MVNSLKKGKRGEYKARKLLESYGYEVVVTSEDSRAADLLVNQEKWEIKYGAHVPKTVYKWLDEKGADALLVKRVKQGRKYPWLIIRKFNPLLDD